MTKSILTEEQKAYLLRIAPNRFNKEITLLINNKFKTNFTENQIKHYKKHNKIKPSVRVKIPFVPPERKKPKLNINITIPEKIA